MPDAAASYAQNRHQGKEPIPPHPATRPKYTIACAGREKRRSGHGCTKHRGIIQLNLATHSKSNHDPATRPKYATVCAGREERRSGHGCAKRRGIIPLNRATHSNINHERA